MINSQDILRQSVKELEEVFKEIIHEGTTLTDKEESLHSLISVSVLSSNAHI